MQIQHGENVCIYYIVGLTSFGNAYCGLSPVSGVYTRTSQFIDWIERKVWG
jgi:secreted trypsin-like serine protease